MLCPIQNTRPHYSPDALSDALSDALHDALHDAHQRKDTKKESPTVRTGKHSAKPTF